jgi:hypothetical protein
MRYFYQNIKLTIYMLYYLSKEDAHGIMLGNHKILYRTTSSNYHEEINVVI